MALKTPEQYEDSLRKMNFKIYLMGDLVKNWVDHPIIRPSMNSVKMTYALAQKPEYEDLMTATSHLTGKKINRFTHLHQSTEDLMKKVKMQRLMGQQTAACFQRCRRADIQDLFDGIFAAIFPSEASWEKISVFGKGSDDRYIDYSR